MPLGNERPQWLGAEGSSGASLWKDEQKPRLLLLSFWLLCAVPHRGNE